MKPEIMQKLEDLANVLQELGLDMDIPEPVRQRLADTVAELDALLYRTEVLD
jgi:type III secretion system FlhB-like substrate exporter